MVVTGERWTEFIICGGPLEVSVPIFTMDRPGWSLQHRYDFSLERHIQAGQEVATTRHSIMLSSTYKELREHRAAVSQAAPGQGMFPLGMANDAALPDQDLIDASLAKVDEADAYVGLISYRYGQMPYDPAKIKPIEYEADIRRLLAEPPANKKPAQE